MEYKCPLVHDKDWHYACARCTTPSETTYRVIECMGTFGYAEASLDAYESKEELIKALQAMLDDIAECDVVDVAPCSILKVGMICTLEGSSMGEVKLIKPSEKPDSTQWLIENINNERYWVQEALLTDAGYDCCD